MDQQADGDTDAAQARKMFASHSVIPPLPGFCLFEVLAPDFVWSPIWLPFKSDKKNYERGIYIFAIPDILLWVLVFGGWHTLFIRKLSLKCYLHSALDIFSAV